MKKIFSVLKQKGLSLLPMLAILMAVSSASSTCFFTSYQPDVPEGLKKFQH